PIIMRRSCALLILVAGLSFETTTAKVSSGSAAAAHRIPRTISLSFICRHPFSERECKLELNIVDRRSGTRCEAPVLELNATEVRNVVAKACGWSIQSAYAADDGVSLGCVLVIEAEIRPILANLVGGLSIAAPRIERLVFRNQRMLKKDALGDQ